jgi:hypothetical protein
LLFLIDDLLRFQVHDRDFSRGRLGDEGIDLCPWKSVGTIASRRSIIASAAAFEGLGGFFLRIVTNKGDVLGSIELADEKIRWWLITCHF